VRSYENVSWKIVEWRRYDSLRDLHKEGALQTARINRKGARQVPLLSCAFKRWITGTTASDQGVPINAPPSHFSRKAREV
jgi:hypothetical protein